MQADFRSYPHMEGHSVTFLCSTTLFLHPAYLHHYQPNQIILEGDRGKHLIPYPHMEGRLCCRFSISY
jgi:hypothetical protein